MAWLIVLMACLQEIDFVMSDLSLEIIGDFAIVWLLSPKKTFAAAPTSAIGKITSQLPGHALQVPCTQQIPMQLTVSVPSSYAPYIQP